MSPLALALLLAAVPATPEGPGPHGAEHAAHQGEAPAVRAPAGPPRLRAGPPRVSTRVYGYLPYWVPIDLATFPWDLVTDVLHFSLDLSPAGAIEARHGWPDTALVQAAHGNGVKVHVVAVLFGNTDVAALLADPAARARAITALVDEAASTGADGINIDFESVNADSRDAFVTFITELRLALRAQVPEGEVTIATPAYPAWYPGYDLAALGLAADRLLIMGYDFHWRSGPTAGPVAPLTAGGFWGAATVTAGVDDYLAETAGDRLALGVPYYGFDWPTTGPEAGASTTGNGSAVFYDEAAGLAAQHGRLWDAPSQNPWATWAGPRQLWYDDAESLGLKYELAKDRGLGGIMIWALGYDGARPELWEAIDTAFGGPPRRVHLAAASYEPATVAVGEPVTVRFTVVNDTAVELPTQDPPPGTVYTEGDSFESRGFPKVTRAWRVGLESSDRPAEVVNHPYRWGLGAPLAPGESRSFEGQLVFLTPGHRELSVGLIEEFVAWREEGLFPGGVDVIEGAGGSGGEGGAGGAGGEGGAGGTGAGGAAAGGGGGGGGGLEDGGGDGAPPAGCGCGERGSPAAALLLGLALATGPRRRRRFPC